MKESDFQSLFAKYLKTNPPEVSETYELKICKKGALPFKAVKDHQVKGLYDAYNGLYHKISDTFAMNGFAGQKPFDCMYLKYIQGYVLIWYYKPRQSKELIKIPIKIWELEKKISKRKSLTEERAKQIGEVIKI